MLKVTVNDLTVGFTFQHDLGGFGEDIGIKGITQCTLHVTEKPKQEGDSVLTSLYNGAALCSSLDVWNRDKGRKIALARAMRLSDLDKTVRTAVWIRYHHRNLTNEQYAKGYWE